MSEGTKRRLAAIVAADVAGYSRLVGADEEGTIDALRAHRRDLIDPDIETHNGRIANTAGDSLLLEFGSVVDAVRCAIAVQEGMYDRNSDIPSEKQIRFRIGVNLGDVVAEGDDLLGDGVNLAARLEGLSEPDGIALSDDAYRQIRDRLDVEWIDGGEHIVKNITRPVQIWRWLPKDHQSVLSEQTADEPLTLPNKPSIAVLPFENLSGDPEQEYFADGMTEDIITELSRFDDLFVNAGNSSFTYKGQHIDVKTVAEELGVRFVLEGSVRKSGQSVRVSVQLINGEDGNHVWAERYDGSIEDIFDLQEQLTRQVVGSIAPHITHAELERVGRGERVFDMAHELAWRAQDLRRASQRNRDPDMLDQAIALASQAVELNAKCGMAYQVLCMGNITKGLNRWGENPSKATDLAEEWANKYYAEMPNAYMAYNFLGLAQFRKGEFADADRNFRRAHDLNPNDAVVLWLWANCEARAGVLESAKEHAHLAIRLSSKRDIRLGAAYQALATAAYLENDVAGFQESAGMALQMMPYSVPMRALMVAYAAESGNQSLLDTNRDELIDTAPDFVASLFSGENKFFNRPEHMEMLLNGLRRAGFSD